MIVSHEHKFIFIANGKTGTRSVERLLGRYQEGEGLCSGEPGLWVGGHLPAAAAREKLGEEIWNSYFTFAFVRNPWDWVVSQHFYNMVPKPRWLLSKNPLFMAKRAVRTLNQGKYLRWQKLSVRDVHDLHEALRPYRGVQSADSLYQTNKVADEAGEVIVDRVCRFEAFDDELKDVLKHIGLEHEVSVPHVNPTKHRHWRTYYTPASADAVHHLWRRDVERFGYSHPFAMRGERVAS